MLAAEEVDAGPPADDFDIPDELMDEMDAQKTSAAADQGELV